MTPPAARPIARNVLFPLFLVSLFHFVDRSLVVIAVEPLRAEFALDDFSLSLLTGAAYSLPYALALIPLGLLADRADRARLVTVMLALFSLATGVIGLAGSLAVIVLGRMAVGASEAGVIPASLSLLAEQYGPADRSRAFGKFFLASALGTIISFGLGSVVIERFGWRIPFLAAAAAGLAAVVVLAACLRDGPRSGRIRSEQPMSTSIGVLFKEPRLVSLWLGGMFSTAMLVGFWAWTASLFQREFALSIGEAGALLAYGAGALAGLGTYLGGALYARLRKAQPEIARSSPAVLAAFSSVAVVGTAASSQLPWALAAFSLASLLLPMFLPIIFALGSEGVVPERSATNAAIQQFANNAVGATLGPTLVGGVSVAAASLRTGLLCLAGLGLASAACFLASRR